MYGLSIECLGSFKVKVDNEIIPLEQWKSKKSLTLFKYLAAKQGEKVSLDTIVEVLWPGSTVEMSTNNLYTTVYNLRKTLDPTNNRAHSWVRNSNGLYWLELSENCYLDIAEFQRCITLGSKLSETEPTKAMEFFLQAISIYRGRFLAEIEHETWTSALGDYYQRKYAKLVIKTAKLLVKCNQDYAQAISLLQKAIEKEPYREELYKQTIVYMVETGRSLEALIEYQNYTNMLQTNFGIAPNQELWQLICSARHPTTTTKNTFDNRAFQCDPASFKIIMELEQRRIERHNQSLILLTINTGNGLVSKITQLTLQIFRRGDVICQYLDSLLVLLSVDKGSNVHGVISRLERVFYAELETSVPMKYQIVGDGKEIQLP